MTAPSDRALAHAFREYDGFADAPWDVVQGIIAHRAEQIDTQQPQQAEGGYVRCTCGCPNGLKHFADAHPDDCAATPQLGARVPDAIDAEPHNTQHYADGWNDCRDAMLGQQPAQGDGVNYEQVVELLIAGGFTTREKADQARRILFPRSP